MPSYSIQAGFENIDSPELIAASLSILEKEGWVIKDYNSNFLRAEKLSVSNQIAELTVTISKKDVTIEGNSELAETANQFIVDSFATELNKFVSSKTFNQQIEDLRLHYFMNNAIQNGEDESSSSKKPSYLKTIFNFNKNFKITPAIILINVLILIIMVLSGISIMMPNAQIMLDWGGVNRSLVLQGQWWRLFTSCFLHYGIIHLAFNMWALHSIGMFLERMIGSRRFAFAYIIAGLAGGLNSIVWHPTGAGAGASGAIFGMFGLFLALLTTNIMEKGFRKSMLQSVVPMILFNLLIGTAGQIDNAAHLGGLFSGLICGYLFVWHFKNPRNKIIDITAFILPLILIISGGFVIHKKLPDKYTHYQKHMKNLEIMELEVVDLENAIPYDSKAAIKIWDMAISEIKKAQSLGLDKDFELRNERILFYIQKRKQEAVLLGKVPEDLELIKKTVYSRDSILKILNDKDE